VHTFYGDSHILHGVSFSLRAGEVLAVLGRNGAGKTTCISTIMGLLKPRSGKIDLFGQPIGALNPEHISHVGVGLARQWRRMFSSLTVGENLLVAQRTQSTTQGSWNVERLYEMFSPAARASPAICRHAFRRRTADAGDRTSINGKSSRASA
jgi:branched-chain amino acid transport system ATP-binding protein